MRQGEEGILHGPCTILTGSWKEEGTRASIGSSCLRSGALDEGIPPEPYLESLPYNSDKSGYFLGRGGGSPLCRTYL